MKSKTFDTELWNTCIEHGGFVGGYAKIGLQMLLVAIGNRKIYESNRKRIERSRAFHAQWRIQNKERLKAYRHEKYWSNPEAEREKRREYYRTHQDQWKLRARKSVYAR